MEPHFHLVARAVILKEGHVLVAQLIGKHSFLPGGHIEVGEGIEACLARELQEELGIECQVGRYLGMTEQTYQDSTGEHYVLSHYFAVTSEQMNIEQAPGSKEPHLRFYWAEVDKLAEHGILPVPVQTLIPEMVAGDAKTWWVSELEKSQITREES